MKLTKENKTWIYYIGLIIVFLVLAAVFVATTHYFNEILKVKNVEGGEEALAGTFILCFIFIVLAIVSIIFYLYFVVKFAIFCYSCYRKKHGIEEIIEIDLHEPTMVEQAEEKILQEQADEIEINNSKEETSTSKQVENEKAEEPTMVEQAEEKILQEKEEEQKKEKTTMKQKIKEMMNDKSNHSTYKK